MNDINDSSRVENYMKGEMQMSQVMDGAHGMWKMKMHFQENIGVATRNRDGKFFNSAAGCSGTIIILLFQFKLETIHIQHHYSMQA